LRLRLRVGVHRDEKHVMPLVQAAKLSPKIHRARGESGLSLQAAMRALQRRLVGTNASARQCPAQTMSREQYLVISTAYDSRTVLIFFLATNRANGGSLRQRWTA
jgi:hypothetical protein